ncbi:hypothetical protein J7643_09915 [bacterium]|nr:hypothetical protein [bacterium]
MGFARRRAPRWIASSLVLLALGGCGLAPQGALTTGADAQAEANGLFSPKLPSDRPLEAAERAGGFEEFLKVATLEALKWDKKALLSGAQAVHVDAAAGKAGGTQFTYLFTAGRNGLQVSISGNNVAFEKAKAGTPFEAGARVTAPQAIQTALATGQIAGEAFIVALVQPSTAKVPVFVVMEHKPEGRRVVVNARTGLALGAAEQTL